LADWQHPSGSSSSSSTQTALKEGIACMRNTESMQQLQQHCNTPPPRTSTQTSAHTAKQQQQRDRQQ
jgi:hypothetical protein